MGYPRLAAALTLMVASATGCAGRAAVTGGFTDVGPVLTESGVSYRSITDGSGPWAIEVVEIAPAQCGVEVRTVIAGDRLPGRETTSELARGLAASTGRPALAAVNGDFFVTTGPLTGAPTGAQVSDGVLLRGPGPRPAFGVDDEGEPFIDVLRLAGAVMADARTSAPLTGLNTTPVGTGVSLYNRLIGDTTPEEAGVTELRLRILGAADGSVGRGVVFDVDQADEGVPVGPGEVVLAARTGVGRFLLDRAVTGDTISWELRLAPVGGVREVIGGSHRLVSAGSISAEMSSMESFVTDRHPRTAVGWKSDGTLLLVVVDGRQPRYSVGMSLPELAGLLVRLGASEAINLDGGGSSTLVFLDEARNRPSDPTGERAVGNALIVLGPAPGACAN